jgi:plastocyanin
MRRCLTAGVLALLVLALGACGGDDSPKVSKDTATTGAEAPTGTKGSTLTIKDFAFAPSPLEAAPGATITVSNSDSTAHTVTADDKGFDTGSVDGGSTKTFTAPSAPGTYAFHCNIHSTMKGSIRVTG